MSTICKLISHLPIKPFARSTTGNVAMLFALTMVPIVLSAGIAVDLSRALVVRERLGQALDAAALAVGGTPGLNDQQKENLVEAFFAANYPEEELGVPGTVNIQASRETVYMSASAELPTTITGVFGFESLTVNAQTEVTREAKGLEVVMVLDNTGSMSGSKIAALKTASTDLVDILFGPQETSQLLKVGLVPFSAAVNIGTDSLTNGWIDDRARSALAGHAFQPGVNVLDLYDRIPNVTWNGCVESRRPPYDVTDDAPSSGNPNTLWLPYFAPDEPDSSRRYDNRYLRDRTGGNYNRRQRFVGKYNGSRASLYGGRGPLRGCSIPPVTPMTNDKQTLLDAIDAMVASGYTHIPLGMAWGWRLVSPGEPFTEGSAYDDKDWNQAIILLTDGQNTVDTESTHNRSNYSAYGYLSERRLGTSSSRTFVNKLNSNLSTICDSVKESKIRVYTITFQLNDPETKTLMRNCATEASLYFDSPSNEELEATFQAIAKDLSNLRLSM